MTHDGPHPECPNCGCAFRPWRRDQRFCSAVCNRDDRRRKRRIAAQRRRASTHRCVWCGTDFEARRRDHDHCSPACRRAADNFWKSCGPRLARAMHDYRVRRRPGAFTDLCRLFADFRAKAKAKAKGMKGKDDVR